MKSPLTQTFNISEFFKEKGTELDFYGNIYKNFNCIGMNTNSFKKISENINNEQIVNNS